MHLTAAAFSRGGRGQFPSKEPPRFGVGVQEGLDPRSNLEVVTTRLIEMLEPLFAWFQRNGLVENCLNVWLISGHDMALASLFLLQCPVCAQNGSQAAKNIEENQVGGKPLSSRRESNSHARA